MNSQTLLRGGCYRIDCGSLGMLVVIITGLMFCDSVVAADHFMTIGGGYDPQGNQISLERNVSFFHQILAEQRTDNPPHDIFFADGQDSHRDLQFRDADFTCSPARQIAIELFGDKGDLDIAYRNHQVPDVRNATSPRQIRNRLGELAKQVDGSDRLILYATAHGGSGDDDTPYNTSLYTWNHRSFRAAEFADWLDELPQETPVVMVMVQCYAGGFAHTIFNQADSKQGLARQLRAGFFAQVHDRPAAGCTPDVDQETYQEYSTFFWAAIAGHTRLGVRLNNLDYDSDGVVSFAEAHAYAVCVSETVDIPVRTSDAFLQYYSTDGTTGVSPYAKARNASEPRRLPSAQLVQARGTIAEVLAHADTVDRVIVRNLAAKLGLNLSDDVDQVTQAKQQAKKKVSQARRESGRAASAYRRANDRTVREVRREWPELAADLSPMLAALMAERSVEFEQKVTAMRSYQSMVNLAEVSREASEASLNAKKAEAIVLRLDHTIKRIILSANLPSVASPQVVDRYRDLLALEAGGLNRRLGPVDLPALADKSADAPSEYITK